MLVLFLNSMDLLSCSKERLRIHWAPGALLFQVEDLGINLMVR